MAPNESEQKPLAGIGVLVTRPAHQAEALCALIEAAGGTPIRFPVLEIAEPADSSALDAVLDHLDQFDLAVFISANAVERAIGHIRAQGGLPSRLRVAAVGRASAKALERLGRAPDFYPKGQFNSEALLALDEMQDLDGQRVVIFRGEGGRELLADTLTERGAQVEYAEVYRRVKPDSDTAGLLRRWARGEVDLAIATSNEGLHNLFELVGKLGRAWLRQTPLIVVSERTRELARELGFTAEVLVADQPGDEALVAAATRWRRRQQSED